MESIHSAAYERLQAQLVPLQSIDPNDRNARHGKLDELIRGVSLREIRGDLLRHILDIREEYGSVAYIADLSEKLGENHYSYPILHLLRKAEFLARRRRIIPGQTRAVETSSGSLAASFGFLTNKLNIPNEIIVSEALPPARIFRVREFNNAGTVTIASAKDGFIAGMVNKLEERLKELRAAGIEHYCLNHSRNADTIEGFSIIGNEINEVLPASVQLDYGVFGKGNATSIHGIYSVLKRDPRHTKMQLACYRDAAKRGEIVSMIGVGGQQGVYFPFINSLPSHSEEELAKEDWKDIYERYNRGKKRKDTIGHSSAGNLAVIRKIIEEERRPLQLLGIFYDKADTTGNTVVTSEDAEYVNNETWSHGYNLQNPPLLPSSERQQPCTSPA